jgi:hypothetical protein
MEQLDPAEFSTSVVTIAEIQCGIERQMAHHPDDARQTQAWLDRFLAIGGATVHGMGVRAALLLARMYGNRCPAQFRAAGPSAETAESRRRSRHSRDRHGGKRDRGDRQCRPFRRNQRLFRVAGSLQSVQGRLGCRAELPAPGNSPRPGKRRAGHLLSGTGSPRLAL